MICLAKTTPWWQQLVTGNMRRQEKIHTGRKRKQHTMAIKVPTQPVEIVPRKEKPRDLKNQRRDVRPSTNGLTGVVKSATNTTLAGSASVSTVENKQLKDKYPRTPGNAKAVRLGETHGSETITVPAAWNQTQIYQLIDETDSQIMPKDMVGAVNGHQLNQLSRHNNLDVNCHQKSTLHGEATYDDQSLENSKVLPYARFRSPVFTLRILDQECIFMFDTGASISLVCPRLMSRFPSLKPSPADSIITGANGKTIPIIGKIFMSLNIGQQTIIAPFIITGVQLENLDGLIGMDLAKVLRSWSVGGTLGGGAYMDINGIHLQLLGFDHSCGTKSYVRNMISNSPSLYPDQLIEDHHSSSQQGHSPQDETSFFSSTMTNENSDDHVLTFECYDECASKLNKNYSWNKTIFLQKDYQVPYMFNQYRNAEALNMINYPLDNNTTESVLKVETVSGGKSFQQEFVSSQPTYSCTNCDVNFIPEEQVCDCIGQLPTPSLKNAYHDTMSMNIKQTTFSDVKEKHSCTPMPQSESASVPISTKKITWEPKYNIAFENSCRRPKLMEEDEFEDKEGQLVYAMTASSIKPHNAMKIEILAEGNLVGRNYIFAPFYDPENYYVLNISKHQSNPKMAQITLYNNTNKTFNWEHGTPLGVLEQVSSVHTATYECQGDRTKYGSDAHEWNSGNQATDLLNTFVSVNQQTNYYMDKEGTLFAGPAPDANTETCHVTFDRPSINDNRENNVEIVTGDLTNKTLFGKSDIICQQVNGSTVSAHGLSHKLENTYPYGTVYNNKKSKHNILTEDKLRTLGTCELLGDDHPSNPYIANLIAQFFYGRASDDKGKQENYATKFADICTPRINQQLREDTKENRLNWFNKALADFHHKLTQMTSEQKPLRVFFPYHIGCTSDQDTHSSYIKSIDKFAESIKKEGIIVYLVKNPETCNGKSENKYQDIQPANHQKHKHRAGRYKDAPSKFCKDPSCKGCVDNKYILMLLEEEIGKEGPESDQPMTGIEDGMSPDANVPSAVGEDERKKLFEELLENANIGEQLTTNQVEEVKMLLRECAKLFITSEDEPAGRIAGLEVDLPTVGDPISCKMRRFNPRALKTMEDLNKTMLRKGLTRPCEGP